MSKQFLGYKIADYWHVEIYFLVPFLVYAVYWMIRIQILLTTIAAASCHL